MQAHGKLIILNGKEDEPLNILFGSWYTKYGTGLTLNEDGTFLDMTHSREGKQDAYEGIWELKDEGILLKFNNGTEQKLLVETDADGDTILWYSFFEEHDGCLMKNLKYNNMSSTEEKTIQEQIEETIKLEEHQVQNVWITYSNDWKLEEGEEKSSITKSRDTINIYKETWVGDVELGTLKEELEAYLNEENNEITTSMKEFEITTEKKQIKDREWLMMYITYKDLPNFKAIFMYTVESGWEYKVEVLSEGYNEDDINRIINSISIPRG